MQVQASLLITCEHAGNEVPAEYQYLFNEATEILQSHEGWDPGAWKIATHLAGTYGIQAHGCHVSRLVVEANRSLDSAQLFSRFIQNLSEGEKQKILTQYYLPYRSSVEKIIKELTKPVVHLSVHTFTPVFHGITRSVDIGLLFDPSRNEEKKFCEHFQSALQDEFPTLSIQYNEPYKGTDDGFTTYLRKQHAAADYAGIELEVNQKFIPLLAEMLPGITKSLDNARSKFIIE